MSQQKKLEKVLDLLLSENSEQASELLHQIIVEKARNIYESIVDEEDDSAEVEEDADSDDEVGGEPSDDFTDEISADKDEVDADHQNDGEAGSDDDEEEGEGDDEFGFDGDDEGFDDEGGGDEPATKDDVADLADQIADLTAEFQKIMGQEMEEPEHADLGGEEGFDDEGFDDEDFGDEDFGDGQGGAAGGMPDFGGQGEQVVGEVVARFEAKKAKKLDKAPEAKKGELKKKGEKKVDEETKFLNQVADTGQRGTAKLVGTGKGMTLGAEQNKSSFTNIPSRKDYGGKPTKVGGNGGSGGEYGKYNGDSAANKTPSDNVKVAPKKVSTKADTTAKYTGGAVAGDGFSKSPLSKKP